jgi:HD-GYP domain-containing protein (c-di-GMP phosphodiesterase class II)
MIEHIGSAPVPFACTETFADDPFTRAAVSGLVETTLHNIALTGAIGFGEIALGSELISQITFHNADAIEALNRIEDHDPYTAIHSLNVCVLALCIAYVDGIDENAAETLATAALLHDIGKTRVPLHILNKPGPLSLRELGVMRRHATYGEAILRDLPGISTDALDLAAQHHERLDGSGYPHGIQGLQFHRLAQLLAVVDVYDGLTSMRVYRSALSPSAALAQIYQQRGIKFSAEMIDLCIGRLSARSTSLEMTV